MGVRHDLHSSLVVLVFWVSFLCGFFWVMRIAGETTLCPLVGISWEGRRWLAKPWPSDGVGCFLQSNVGDGWQTVLSVWLEKAVRASFDVARALCLWWCEVMVRGRVCMRCPMGIDNTEKICGLWKRLPWATIVAFAKAGPAGVWMYPF